MVIAAFPAGALPTYDQDFECQNERYEEYKHPYVTYLVLQGANIGIIDDLLRKFRQSKLVRLSTPGPRVLVDTIVSNNAPTRRKVFINTTYCPYTRDKAKVFGAQSRRALWRSVGGLN